MLLAGSRLWATEWLETPSPSSLAGTPAHSFGSAAALPPARLSAPLPPFHQPCLSSTPRPPKWAALASPCFVSGMKQLILIRREAVLESCASHCGPGLRLVSCAWQLLFPLALLQSLAPPTCPFPLYSPGQPCQQASKDVELLMNPIKVYYALLMNHK